MKIAAVVPSAGRGERMHTRRPKPYIRIADKPLLIHALAVLNGTPCIDYIIVAVEKRTIGKARSLIAAHRLHKVKYVVAGGATRFDSVAQCLARVDADTDMVLVHDGARPFITESMIAQVVGTARKAGASAVGIPLVPTLKRVNRKQRVVATPPRHQFWEAQTPQAFKKNLLLKGYERARRQKTHPTDDAMVVERLGVAVTMVRGSSRNIKVTTPVDLKLAEILFKERNIQ